MDHFIHETASVSEKAVIGTRTKVWHYAQVREHAVIGSDCVLGKNVYIDHGVKIGNNVKIQNNVSVFNEADIHDGVFIGPHVCFTNDKYPRSITPEGDLKSATDWKTYKTVIHYGASIGANATLVPGVTIGKWACIGAGTVVTKDVPDYALVIGNPGKVVGYVTEQGTRKVEPDQTQHHTIAIAKPIIGEEEKKAVMDVLTSGNIVQGEKVKQLEDQFAIFCGTKYAVAVSSGTAALHASLYALGIKEGDEVITTPFTFVATANSILMQNAIPVFVDIDEETYTIDPQKIKEKITPKTKAIIAVDLYGQIYNYTDVKKIANEHNLKIIEDACQSVGAEQNGLRAGNFGDLAVFSFYATKNMMSGEGGMVVTNNEQYAHLVRRFRFHGQDNHTKYEYQDIGYNYRMTDMQAAIAIEQLKKIDMFTNTRRRNARLLSEGLQNIPGIIVPKVKNGKHVFHQYTIRLENFHRTRDELVEHLKKNNIGSNVFYPCPLHLQTNFKRFGYQEGDFPVAEKVSMRVLSLPVHPSVSEEDCTKIIEVLRNV
ncbi:hypothetical protein COV17_03295 [Candidatus Woesearchaeota archaeon CG10_big_fil_rev_8_21_14_0_10_36_11]|nr:MAG: hypothetical protein COV17_03295 [Candidatus Woesearchaeota archaeon CG10_big_fil_rev_8_21_14_0_10_36_11]